MAMPPAPVEYLTVAVQCCAHTRGHLPPPVSAARRWYGRPSGHGVAVLPALQGHGNHASGWLPPWSCLLNLYNRSYGNATVHVPSGYMRGGLYRIRLPLLILPVPVLKGKRDRGCIPVLVPTRMCTPSHIRAVQLRIWLQ